MRISTIKGYVEIVTYEMRHNHPASQEASDEYQPQNWLLSGINVGEDEKAFKRRRRSKKHNALASSSASQSSSTEKTDMITSQLEKLREIAMAASIDKLDVFSSQLADFGERWRDRLQAAYQDVGEVEEDVGEGEEDEEERPDPNASPPILPATSTVKLEGM